MTIDPHYPWHMFEDENYKLIKQRYGDREQLGNDWIEKRKIADKSEFKEDRKPNPLYPRLRMEADIARMAYDMSFLLEANAIMQEQIMMFSSMFQRMAILEGAYSHLMAAHGNVREDYYKKLMNIKKLSKPLQG